MTNHTDPHHAQLSDLVKEKDLSHFKRLSLPIQGLFGPDKLVGFRQLTAQEKETHSDTTNLIAKAIKEFQEFTREDRKKWLKEDKANNPEDYVAPRDLTDFIVECVPLDSQVDLVIAASESPKIPNTKEWRNRISNQCDWAELALLTVAISVLYLGWAGYSLQEREAMFLEESGEADVDSSESGDGSTDPEVEATDLV